MHVLRNISDHVLIAFTEAEMTTKNVETKFRLDALEVPFGTLMLLNGALMGCQSVRGTSIPPLPHSRT